MRISVLVVIGLAVLSAATGQGVKEARHALVQVIGEAPVSAKAQGGAAAMEPWTA